MSFHDCLQDPALQPLMQVMVDHWGGGAEDGDEDPDEGGEDPDDGPDAAGGEEVLLGDGLPRIDLDDDYEALADLYPADTDEPAKQAEVARLVEPAGNAEVAGPVEEPADLVEPVEVARPAEPARPVAPVGVARPVEPAGPLRRRSHQWRTFSKLCSP